jgi:5-oxopent-3-ene-1,2,5-tricarboxylate decarboxylase/2-hydroxyhepta-2,4-diene-1,7-dioate isomerase
MKHARVTMDGLVHGATEQDGQLLLDDGRLVSGSSVSWLPPLPPLERPRTILALDLNYAGESAFQAPAEPLVSLKGERALTGHSQTTRRPADASFVHCGCALAVVIGRTARKLRREDAYDFVAGYTVANDYTIGDALEHGQPPNLRAKNRDGATPLGPWLVDRDSIADPMALALRTTVNGQLAQAGNTRDMIFDVPFLIEYFSSFMTLSPGDLILTGTPAGVADCQPGAVVVTEIEGLGALMNTIGS